MNKRLFIRMRIILIPLFLAAAVSCCSQLNGPTSFDADGQRIRISAGKEWLHSFQVFAFIYQENSPQYAIWLEDMEGNFLKTVAVSEKLAKEKWIFNEGNRRIEALPLWTHRHGVIYSDGMMLPSTEEPLPDAVSAASETASFSIPVGGLPDEPDRRLKIFAEFNHSTDFNDAWPKDAPAGSKGYSGGEYGSGQPAVVYAAEFSEYELSVAGEIELELVGRSSADGSDGILYTDLTGMTSALKIVSSVKLSR